MIKRLRIERVADRGASLARMDGKAVFVELAAPGDLVEAEIVAEKKNFAAARVVRVLEPSPDRVEPPCPHYGECGGCVWQHLAHGPQVEGKAASLQGFFRSRLQLPEEAFGPPISSPNPYGYRNRVTVNLMRGAVFMTGRRSDRRVKIDSCPVASDGLNRALAAFRLSGPDISARALIQEDEEGGIFADLETERPITSNQRENLAGFAKEAGWRSIRVKCAGREETLGEAAPMVFFTEGGGKKLRLEIPVGSFVQANPEVNRLLRAELHAKRSLFKGKTSLDLYCGSGNFTLPLAAEAKIVTGIEGARQAARAAEKNAELNGFKNVRIFAGSVGKTLAKEEFPADFWLLDPPREGASETVWALEQRRPAHLIYISCAPETLLRDLGLFMGKGYKVQSIRAADMFPQTAHLEVISHLALT